MSLKYQEIRDPLYGFIHVNPWELDIINSPAFQRLRRIRQLGLTDMVYPSANHTRFEHSLGVMHLATQFYDKIIEKNHGLLEENGYTTTGLNIDRQLVRLAALLHDIGHGPFSHGSEDLFPIKSGKKHYRHEDYSSVIIRDMLGETIENHEINKQN